MNILHSYVGIIISQYKDPFEPSTKEGRGVLNVAHVNFGWGDSGSCASSSGVRREKSSPPLFESTMSCKWEISIFQWGLLSSGVGWPKWLKKKYPKGFVGMELENHETFQKRYLSKTRQNPQTRINLCKLREKLHRKQLLSKTTKPLRLHSLRSQVAIRSTSYGD